MHRDEVQHRQAVQILNSASGRLLTHSYVLAELVALAQTRRFPRSAVLTFILDWLDSSSTVTVWVSEQLHREAMQLLIARQDKTYSLCDAVSFVLMQQRGLTKTLTTDRHFEQAGKTRLLQSVSSLGRRDRDSVSDRDRERYPCGYC
nr:PIN domain-containing protein [Romeria gracilis]